MLTASPVARMTETSMKVPSASATNICALIVDVLSGLAYCPGSRRNLLQKS
jgi:hypothetical protein